MVEKSKKAAHDAQVAVRFLKRDAPYNPGDVLMVSAARAERWVKEGTAEYAR